jgi:UPF0042 nucleotide-binding protein
MRLVLITGMSGSGKSVALRLLEDIGYYCVDNLPPRFLPQVAGYLADAGQDEVAVSVDARSELSLGELPQIIGHLRNAGHDLRVLFLTASTESLIQRYSETRRRHPLSGRLAIADDGLEPTLAESIEAERELLAPLDKAGHVIDTSGLAPATLRDWVRRFVGSAPAPLTLTFESFAFKNGVPASADLLFDVRNLPNPFYEPALRPLTGLDAPVVDYLERSPIVAAMIDDIDRFIARWLPSYHADNRHYLTVAIGCTGGQHRSPYVVERLAARFAARERERVLARHRNLGR